MKNNKTTNSIAENMMSELLKHTTGLKSCIHFFITQAAVAIFTACKNN
jgi:hypothetical protein